jgi:hypothetical protein
MVPQSTATERLSRTYEPSTVFVAARVCASLTQRLHSGEQGPGAPVRLPLRPWRHTSWARSGNDRWRRGADPRAAGRRDRHLRRNLCIGHTDSSLINSVTGLPGPGASLLPATVPISGKCWYGTGGSQGLQAA